MSLSCTTSGRSSLASATACRITSITGHKVMPSPYGRHLPARTVACSWIVEVNSWMSQGLPDARRAQHGEQMAGAVSGMERSKASWRRLSSRSRPTIRGN